jgi:GntR family transcriptional regulator
MILTLSDFADESLQSQIRRQLRAKILNGDLKPEESLPSIRGLARQVKVSVITVQRAYETLQNEGLVHSRRGKGFFVAPISGNQKKEIALERLREGLEPLIRHAIEEGISKEEISRILQDLVNNGS